LLFKTRTSDQSVTALKYLKGLFQGQKRNMERMCERVVDSEYYQLQHFISESPWDHRAVMDAAATDVSGLFADLEMVGLLIDESAHVKKGRQSVGVARQYCGTLGKVDNCQVAVYGALSANKYYGLIDTELYLPKEWTDDKKRCKKAGVPKERMIHQSKPQLALQIVKRQIDLGTRFNYVAADGLYGNDYTFQQQLEHLGILYMLEVHQDQHVYVEPPVIRIPENESGRGRKPSRYKTDAKPVEVRQLKEQLAAGVFRRVHIRQGTKGAVSCKAAAIKVYTWDGRSAHYNERLLLIRITEKPDGAQEVKYAVTNAAEGAYSLEVLVGMQSQRYFVERALQEVKQDAGMSEYQVRGWRAWHHHMALVIFIQSYILSEKKLFENEMPFLSAYDLRQVIMNTYAVKGTNYEDALEQIKERHRQRKADIDRNNFKT
jgi:SRSO17 transposase